MTTKKKFVSLGSFLLIIAFGIFVYFRVTSTNSSDQSASSSIDAASDQTSLQKSPSNTTRLLAAGDIIGHDSLNLAAELDDDTYSYTSFMDQMKPILESADIRFCNQSTLIGGEQFPITGYPSFNAPEALARDIAAVGCNLINTASNHSSDKTQKVIDANTALWETIPNILAVAGQNRSEAEQKEIKYFEVKGLKYAFLAYTTYSNTAPSTSYSVNMYSREVVSAQVAEAKQNGVKFVIASMRWGTEYSQTINAQQEQESQYLADIGVSLVLGHGPHVLEPVKRLQGTNGNSTVVWYSLGNFLQTQIGAESLFSSVGVIDIDSTTGVVQSVGYVPIYMHYEWTADEAVREDLLKRKNFELLPVERSAELFAKSQLSSQTTLAEQEAKIDTILNSFTEVKRLYLKDFGL